MTDASDREQDKVNQGRSWLPDKATRTILFGFGMALYPIIGAIVSGNGEMALMGVFTAPLGMLYIYISALGGAV